jgi:transposase
MGTGAPDGVGDRLIFEGIFALSRGLLESDPLAGHLFCFCNKARTRLKVLYWDGSGLSICVKRLEKLKSAPFLVSCHPPPSR